MSPRRYWNLAFNYCDRTRGPRPRFEATRDHQIVPRYDIAVYCPRVAGLLRRGEGRAAGAEKQMLLLARELGRRGFRVALVSDAIGDRLPGSDAGLNIVERPPRHAPGGLVKAWLEAVRVLRSLLASDARVFIVTTGTPVVGFIAMYCRLRRRRFIFASANDLDFDLDRSDPSHPGAWERRRWLYRAGMRLVDAVAVMSRDQLSLARNAFPSLTERTLVFIPYIAEEPAVKRRVTTPSEFLWAARGVEVKRPHLYAELAAAVPSATFTMILMARKDEPIVHQMKEEERHLANLTLLGGVPQAELQERLVGAVALVSTSYIEGWPNTYLEAWSLGVPVLTLLCDPDAVVAERGLGVAADGSWERFVAGAEELWRTRNERSELSRRTISYIQGAHTPAVVGAAWVQLITDLGVRQRAGATGGPAGASRRRVPKVMGRMPTRRSQR